MNRRKPKIARIHDDSLVKMTYSPKGTRKCPQITMGQPIPQPQFTDLRHRIKSAIDCWDAAHLMAYENGTLLLLRKEPANKRFLVGKYERRFSSYTVRADIFRAMRRLGFTIANVDPRRMTKAEAEAAA